MFIMYTRNFIAEDAGHRKLHVVALARTIHIVTADGDGVRVANQEVF